MILNEKYRQLMKKKKEFQQEKKLKKMLIY